MAYWGDTSHLHFHRAGQGQPPGSSLALDLAEQEKDDFHDAWVISKRAHPAEG